jgi:hypothetical protein
MRIPSQASTDDEIENFRVQFQNQFTKFINTNEVDYPTKVNLKTIVIIYSKYLNNPYQFCLNFNQIKSIIYKFNHITPEKQKNLNITTLEQLKQLI